MEVLKKNHQLSHKSGALVLENGEILWGYGIGAKKAVIGELCFNTSQTGYQEALTDPSYNKQIILGKFEGINEIRNFTNCFTQIDKFDEKIWAEKINEKLCEKINKRKKNFLNKKFLSHYSDYECFQSFQESIN